MIINGKFNTNSEALKRRIESHENFGTNDINKWIFQNLELEKDITIADLGCGTGKQSIPLAQFVGANNKIFSVDISQESLNTLYDESIQKGVNEKIELICCDLDNIKSHLLDNCFDRVLGSFSLYYSKNPSELFTNIYNTLKPGGVLFFCGPSKDNNRELKSFQNNMLENPDSTVTGGALFMEKTGQELAKDIFGEIKICTFENKLQFNSCESLYSYWSSYNLYRKNLESSFIINAKKHFEINTIFETTKRVLGIKAIKNN